MLAWRPQLVLIDELAHTNARVRGIREALPDVPELPTRIDVLPRSMSSTSRAAATPCGRSWHARQTVPDSVLDAADETS